ncbi:DEAD/DEAH box helicase [Kutzneria chonburiensis]|uniref:DEAD/DEAH box helicase n=1 Tax=Kutzneria chonburiensis TaxID=1483604 RepID=A0ABV6MZV8_9PSEU|nr:DEAD/DEAH box helicase [Kutzneria chonburiensis]
MSSARSGSEPAASGFDLLHRDVQRWVWQRGWSDLHDVQDRAVQPILGRERDVLIGAATAAGKTEAAFLPICSDLVSAGSAGAGVQVLYLSPLKALINDQFRRVDDLCEGLGIPTHRWHGDVAQSKKTALVKDPGGILLTTPESLEAMFVRRGPQLRTLFAGLRYVVVDELHSFLGVERGTQLISLLHRLETALRDRVPRIGLSATLGDMSIAAEQLRPGGGTQVTVIDSPSGGQDVRLQIRAFVDRPPPRENPAASDPDMTSGPAVDQVAAHLFRVLRGSTNLAFANSRNMVEALASRLADLSQQTHVSNEFHPHHGSLAKELREDVEASLRDPSRPSTAVCTSTLEMGIDIGDIAQVAQIGAPPSVAALRQRIGRSGRRGTPAVLRGYVTTSEPDAHSTVLDRLHPHVVQLVADVELLREHWCEPPRPARQDLSTLVQQLLSLIVQHGGARPEEAYRVLCGRGGPFTSVSQRHFGMLLRDLATHEVLTQSDDRTLLAGPKGDLEVNHYSFYAAFHTAEEYRLVHGDATLGTLPVDQALHEEQLIIFAGRRWRVVAVHDEDKIIQLMPAPGGKASIFGLSSGRVHATVRARMRSILAGGGSFPYLDSVARQILEQGRRAFAELRLDERGFVREGRDVLVLPWTGDLELDTLAQLLILQDLDVAATNVALVVSGADVDEVRAAVKTVSETPPPAEIELARTVLNKMSAKYDKWLGDELLAVQYASMNLDCPAAVQVAKALAAVEQLRT